MWAEKGECEARKSLAVCAAYGRLKVHDTRYGNRLRDEILAPCSSVRRTSLLHFILNWGLTRNRNLNNEVY